MQKPSYKLVVNGEFDFEVDNIDLVTNSVIAINESEHHVIADNKSVEATVVSTDMINKIVTVELDGQVYEVAIKDAYDLLVKEMGLSANAVKKITDIKAPMPGLVLDILVKAGDTLNEGDSILILEAMKMENVLKSPGEITIKKIEVVKGDAVEKNQILISLES